MVKRFSTLGRYPTTRLRRNRREDWSRRLVAEHKLSVDDLIWPVFVQEGKNQRTPVESMPGVDRLTVDLFIEAAKQARDLGIPAIAIFPETDPKSKTPDGREAYNPGNLVCRAITAVKKAVPDIGVLCDVALDPFNSDGHDGIVRDGYVQNDETLEALVKQASVPTYAYQVSGEYAMLKGAADRGWLDWDKVLIETLTGFKRAGCDGILTYGAVDAAKLLKSK